MNVTTLPIAPELFWPIASLIGLIACVMLVSAILRLRMAPEENALDRLKAQLGLTGFNSGLFFVAIVFWGLLFLALFVSLVMTVFHATGLMLNQSGADTIRGDVILIAGLTATLGAVVALPFTLIRLMLTRNQAQHAEEVLFNEKITEAQRDLFAQRQTTLREGSGYVDVWEDDIIRRNAAIDQLERLVEERPEVVGSVARTLSVYVRELSKREVAEQPPEDTNPEVLDTWARALKPRRSDMEKAAQTLGRLRQYDQTLDIDLHGANLQAMSLAGLDFDTARLSDAQLQGASLYGAQLQGASLYGAQLQGASLYGAQLQGADLGGAQLQGASLYGAQLQGASLYGAQLQGASLYGAQLQGANLGGAQLQGASLYGAAMDEATSLSRATLRGARLREADYTQVTISQHQIDTVFGDVSVKLPESLVPPERFSREYESWDDFNTAWRAWQAEIGFDPVDSATW